MEKTVLQCEDIMRFLGVSDGMAYKIIKELNAKGFHTVRGRVSAQYFIESFYGVKDVKEAV